MTNTDGSDITVTTDSASGCVAGSDGFGAVVRREPARACDIVGSNARSTITAARRAPRRFGGSRLHHRPRPRFWQRCRRREPTLANQDVLTVLTRTAPSLGGCGVVDGRLFQTQLGAIQNRFTSAVSNLQRTAQNLTQSRSTIQDADFAAETANLTQAQVLEQAGISVLAQANQQPQLILKLLQ